jgi:hypothetical protein
MPRYLIEREFIDGLNVPLNDTGAALCRTVVEKNAEFGVTWIHSYATPNRRHTFCVYEGPSPEALRRAADCNKLPVTRITEVRVLEPYFFK